MARRTQVSEIKRGAMRAMDQDRQAVLSRVSQGETLKNVAESYGCSSALVLSWLKTREPNFRALRPRVWSGSSAFSLLFNRYKSKAKERGYRFDLSKDQFLTLIQGPCHYCRTAPSQMQKADTPTGTPIVYSGIDRKDNSLGYSVVNSVSCCNVCNRAKSTLTEAEFRAWAQRLSQHFGGQ